MTETNILASRYAAIFTHMVFMGSFHDKYVDIDGHDSKKVIVCKEYRKQCAKNDQKSNINLKMHPIMQHFDDPDF